MLYKQYKITHINNPFDIKSSQKNFKLNFHVKTRQNCSIYEHCILVANLSFFHSKIFIE